MIPNFSSTAFDNISIHATLSCIQESLTYQETEAAPTRASL